MQPGDTPIPLIRPGARVRGLDSGDVPVTVVAVDSLTYGDATEYTYRTDSGEVRSVLVHDAQAERLELVGDSGQRPAFSADAREFVLAAEALRIKYAALYDPMSAVSSSEVQPLPHQIRAVYEEMLPRIPLRFLLADDPGAGKTIMAGLYIKEMILRSDCERALIVAPGSLVEQWRDELHSKFDLSFEIFSREMVDDAPTGNPFGEDAGHPYLIARMDQLARAEDLTDMLKAVPWDVVVVDEAHRMSAHYSSWRGEVNQTQRFRLGRILSDSARNLLLMTATPHSGKQEDFELFLSLLDPDRFEGRHREGVHHSDTKGIMRRMVKEDLLTFEGRPLFPERRAQTVSYELSPEEAELYEDVTAYVRNEMGRADKISEQGDRKRGNNVGFALTVLQRRLASSPEAILRSLERRRDRLRDRLREAQELRANGATGSWTSQGTLPIGAFSSQMPVFDIEDFDDLEDEVSEEDRPMFDAQVDTVVDLATAAQTVEELRIEIGILDNMVDQARRVRANADSGDADRKWAQLRSLLESHVLEGNGDGAAHKMIVFSEHRDTVDYLRTKIAQFFGDEDSVVTIHGAMRREERLQAQERFTQEPETLVLVATDAAGEGLNLQRAHLMVNYDLPWNPNRIEQRFGRIHRIGQREVCHLWNLVAAGTREGDVFLTLLGKIDQQASAYEGNLFNVLGEGDAFQGRSLKELLIEAIRYGEEPAVRAKLNTVINEGVSVGLSDVVNERALTRREFGGLNLDEVRGRMEEARRRRLQPGYVQTFFSAAFSRLGGSLRQRENGRFEIVRVPPRLREEARQRNRWAPVAQAYERICFDPSKVHHDRSTDAALIAAGHPLLESVTEATIKDLEGTLVRGTVLVDRRDRQDDAPLMVYTVEERIEERKLPHRTVSHHFDHVAIMESGSPTLEDPSFLLNFDPPTDVELRAARVFLDASWVDSPHDATVRAWAFTHGLAPRAQEIRDRLGMDVQRTRAQVQERLNAEINNWYSEVARAREEERDGKHPRVSAAQALTRAERLEQRLRLRMADLDHALDFDEQPPNIRSVAFVIPAHLLESNGGLSQFSRDTVPTERRAVDDVLASERALGRDPEEQSHSNPGFDILSRDEHGRSIYIEVKGRQVGAEDFIVTANEVAFAQTHAGDHILALVSVDLAEPVNDRVRYVREPFGDVRTGEDMTSATFKWQKMWERGNDPR